MPLIYVVDDESSIRETLREILQDEGHDVVDCSRAEELFEKVKDQSPALVLLDIWLPGANGMEVLKTFKAEHPEIPVIMMSGHAGIETAVSSIKLGAYDFLEKPVHLEVLLDKISGALKREGRRGDLPSDMGMETVTLTNGHKKGQVELVPTNVMQRTVGRDVVLNGTGLLSGKNTGIILSPLGPDEGIVFQSLEGKRIPGVITSLENFSPNLASKTFTASSTVLAGAGFRVRTVEHLMGALHMFGITNALIKTDEEIPNVDGSGIDFCRLLKDAGFVEQDRPVQKLVIHDRIQVGDEDPEQKFIYAEPWDGFQIDMRINYAEPINEQTLSFNPDANDFERDIAPARSFNTLQNIDMAQQMGKAGKGFLNSHIILHEGKVINTSLRFPDEFIRHKILDLLGDLYLLGHPIQGRFVANMTSHGYNQALAQKIHAALNADSTS